MDGKREESSGFSNTSLARLGDKSDIGAEGQKGSQVRNL